MSNLIKTTYATTTYTTEDGRHSATIIDSDQHSIIHLGADRATLREARERYDLPFEPGEIILTAKQDSMIHDRAELWALYGDPTILEEYAS